MTFGLYNNRQTREEEGGGGWGSRFSCLDIEDSTSTDNIQKPTSTFNPTPHPTKSNSLISPKTKHLIKHPIKHPKSPLRLKGGGNRKEGARAEPRSQVTTKGIKTLYTNADQLRNKLGEMRDRITLNQPDVIAINEVKPKANADYKLEEFNIDPHNQYEMLHNNIENSTGRGQMLLIRKSLKHRQVYMKTDFSEYLCAEFDLKGKDKLLVAMIYRSESEGETMSKKLVELIHEICNKAYTHILITGDFNYKSINWDEAISKDKIETRFLNCIMDNYLHQHITEPTRWRGDNRPSLLDLLITNEENMIENLDIQAPIGLSDHAVISFTYKCYAEVTVEKFTKKKYHQAKYLRMKDHLKTVSWENLKKTDDMDDAGGEFLRVYRHLEDKFVPTVTKRTDFKDSMPLEKSTLDLIKEKTKNLEE